MYHFLSLLFTVFLFGSCVEQIPHESLNNETFSNGDTVSSPAPIPSEDIALSGEKLYEINCMSCHNPLGNSTKKNTSELEIIDAIKLNSQMKNLANLKALSLEQIGLIVTALKNIDMGENSDTDSLGLDQTYIIGTRTYIASKFKRLFYDQDQNSEVLNIINKNILDDKFGTFGGNCTITEQDCKGDSKVMVGGLMLPNSTLVRSATIFNTCQEVLSFSSSTLSVLDLAGLTENSSGADPENVNKVLGVFYPGIPVSNEIRNGLISLYNSLQLNGMSNLNSWRFTIDSMCKTTLFETY